MSEFYWYWRCTKCGHVQPAHPETTEAEMGTCTQRRPTGNKVEGMVNRFGNRPLEDEYGPCGGRLVKHKARKWDEVPRQTPGV